MSTAVVSRCVPLQLVLAFAISGCADAQPLPAGPVVPHSAAQGRRDQGKSESLPSSLPHGPKDGDKLGYSKEESTRRLSPEVRAFLNGILRLYKEPGLFANRSEVFAALGTEPGREGSGGKFNEHATLVAGVMVADRNGSGGVGVAYDATVAGHWLSAGDLSALSRMQQYDVVNHSWAPDKNFGLTFSPAVLGALPPAYEDAVQYGRNGLGTVVITAGGNDRAKGGNTNYSNVSNTRSGIVVGAINAKTDLGALQIGGQPFSKGDGQDTLRSGPTWTAGKINTLEFKTGIAPSEVVLSQSGWSLVLSIAGTTDKVTAEKFFFLDSITHDSSSLQQVKFADGTTWNAETLKNKLFAGTSGADVISGTTVADVINGQVGNDRLQGRDGSDSLYGGAGNDDLYGDAGNDRLDGGVGNDRLEGGVGNDTYVFGRGEGQDSVWESDATVGNTDVLSFGQGIATDQLWFRRVSIYDLEVSLMGTADKINIYNWYLSGSNHVEQFKTSDGKVLLDSEVQNLVQAMAAFSPPAAGQTTLPASYQNSLGTVIAANWHQGGA